MGQRHQAFLLARVTGDGELEYCCVAAVHHHYCSGNDTLLKVYRFLQLVAQKDNAALLREDLRTFSQESPQPCPYAASLLQTSFRCNLEEELSTDYGSSLDVQFDLPWYSENNSGTTFIDVSDPEHILLSFQQYRTDLITARDYQLVEEIRQGCSTETDPRIVEELQLLPPISPTSLAEAWPQVYGHQRSKWPGVLMVEAVQKIDTCKPVRLPTLVDIAFDRALDVAIKTSQIEVLSAVTSVLAQKLPMLVTQLRQVDSFSTMEAVFLAKIFGELSKYPAEIDMSGFNLTGYQIILALGSSVTSVRCLDLSNNSKLDKQALATVLTHLKPSLRWLNIIQTSVSNTDLLDLLETCSELFYHNDSILHPVFINPEYTLPPQSSIEFQLFLVQPSGVRLLDWDESARSIPLFSIDSCIRHLRWTIQNLVCLGAPPCSYFSSIAWNSMLASNPISTATGQPSDWIHRVVTRLIADKSTPTISSPRQAPARYRVIFQYTELDGRSVPNHIWRYGILVVGNSEESVNEMLDVRAFVKRLEKDGRGPHSSPTGIDQLCDLIEAAGFELFTAETYKCEEKIES